MVSIDRVLCAVDFSDISRHALQQAIAIARWYDARLTVLHAFTPPYVPPVVGSPELIRAALPTAAALQQLRDRLAEWLSTDAPGVAADVLVEQGTVAWCILACATENAADLIVIGTHGHGGFDRLVLGSVAERVLRKATCPVLTVPPPAGSPRQLPFKRMLCAVDFSMPSLSAVRYALAMAREADARLVLLHAVDWPVEDKLVEIDEELLEYRHLRETRAARDLAALVPKSEEACEPVILLEHGRAWPTIVRVAEQDHSDLIVIGIHGRNVLDVTLFGSTANQVVRHAPCPVLTIRQ